MTPLKNAVTNVPKFINQFVALMISPIEIYVTLNVSIKKSNTKELVLSKFYV